MSERKRELTSICVLDSLFGRDLAEQVKIEGSRIPLIVTKCVQEIELRGLTVEGIYRKSGSLQQVKDLQDMMETSQDVNLSECDIAVVASLLKLYLRSLPVPLIPNKMICKLQRFILYP